MEIIKVNYEMKDYNSLSKLLSDTIRNVFLLEGIDYIGNFPEGFTFKECLPAFEATFGSDSEQLKLLKKYYNCTNEISK